MARPKNTTATASSKPNKSENKMSSVKEGRVSKPVASTKPSKKDAAATAAAAASKVGKKDKGSKKAKKEPTPVSDSSSESDEESGSSDSSDGSDSDSEPEAKPQPNGHSKVANGSGASNAKKPAPAKGDSDDDSEDDSEEDSEDESDSDDVPAKASTGGKAAVANGAGAAAKPSSDAEDSDDDEDSEGSEGSDAASSESDSSDDEDEDEDKTEAPAKKRKADVAEPVASKKAKTADAGNGTKNLFVGNLTWSVDDEWLQREFSAFGECSARVMTGPDGRSKGFGFVEFTAPEHAQEAHDAKKGTELDGRPLNVDYATPRGEPNDRSQRTNQRADKFGDSKSNPSDTLWIGNISFGATAEMLQEAFEEYGTVTRVHLPTDQETGALRGFGHIGMGSVDEAKAALEAMNGVSVDGRPIRLDYASPRQENGGGGGGFRGGRGGGRGGRGDFGGRGGRGGFGGRGGGRGRGGAPRGRGASFNRGGFGDFSGSKISL